MQRIQLTLFNVIAILGNEYQAYVVLDKTELRDVSSGSERLFLKLK